MSVPARARQHTAIGHRICKLRHRSAQIGTRSSRRLQGTSMQANAHRAHITKSAASLRARSRLHVPPDQHANAPRPVVRTVGALVAMVATVTVH